MKGDLKLDGCLTKTGKHCLDLTTRMARLKPFDSNVHF